MPSNMNTTRHYSLEDAMASARKELESRKYLVLHARVASDDPMNPYHLSVTHTLGLGRFDLPEVIHAKMILETTPFDQGVEDLVDGIAVGLVTQGIKPMDFIGYLTDKENGKTTHFAMASIDPNEPAYSQLLETISTYYDGTMPDMYQVIFKGDGKMAFPLAELTDAD